MTRVGDMNVQELSGRLGVPEGICRVFLSHPQRYAPDSGFRIVDSEYPTAIIKFPTGDILELECRECFVLVSGHNGYYVEAGIHYCTLVVRGTITDDKAALDFLAQFEALVVNDTELGRVLERKMRSVYERIEQIHSHPERITQPHRPSGWLAKIRGVLRGTA